MAAPIDTQKQADIQNQLNKAALEYEKLKQQLSKLDEKSVEYKQKEIELLKIEIENVNILIEKNKILGQNSADLLKLEQEKKAKIEEIVKALKEQNEVIAEQKKLTEEVIDLSRSFANDIQQSLGIIHGDVGKMLDLFDKSGGKLNAINNTAIELSKNLKRGIAEGIAAKGQEMFVTFFHLLDEVGANLAKVIPNGRAYQGMIEDITAGSQASYLSFEQVGESVISLNSSFTEFSRLQKTEQAELVKFGATLDKIGVSTETFAENLDIATKSMGYSSDEFLGLEKQMFTMSKTLGVNMDTLNKRFKDASGKLAQFEKTKAIKIFKDLNVASKNLGIEFNKLIEISGQFDTFESAAEAAGSLNSVLGGNLINTIDLMNASLDNPIEVFKQFKVAVDKTGRSFDSMTPAMKKMIAETMKMDVSEVERLMRMDLSQGIEDMENAAASMEDMEEAARLATPVLDKLLKIGYKFAGIMSPIVDIVGSIVDKISVWVAENPKLFKTLGAITMGIGAAAVAATGLFKVLALIKALSISSGAAGLVTSLLGKGVTATAAPVVLTKIGTAATAGSKGFMALGAAALMIGAGIGVAALGISQFVLAFKGMSPEQIMAVSLALGVFSAGLIVLVLVLAKLAPAAAAAGVGLLPLGAAIGLIGAGIGLAAWGMSKLVTSFAEFMAVADLEKIAGLYLGINGLALSFGALAASFVAIGLASPSLVAFGVAVRLSLTDSVIGRLQSVAQYVSAISVGLQNMKPENLTALANASAGINTSGANSRISSAVNQGRAASNNRSQTVVYVPGETIKVEIKAPIMLNGDKVGEFVQEEIVKREDRLVPGGLQSAVGVKTGRYND